MDRRALCIGLANWDYVFTVDDAIREDQKYRAQGFAQSGGGPAANAACLLGRWGYPVALVAQAGCDLAGTQVVLELQRYGVDLAWFQRSDGASTSLSCVIVNAGSGSRTVVNQPLAQPLPRDPALLPWEVPGAILVDGHEAALSLLALEQFPETLSVLDGGSLRDSTEELASKVDYSIVSSAFASSATGLVLDGEREIARCVEALSRRFSSRICITLGARGLATLRDDGSLLRGKAPTVLTRDSTAAGDIFHGAFVWARLAGHEYQGALQVATAAAALSVTCPGGRASIPSRVDALKFASDGWSQDEAGVYTP